ncbi:hypothetical protein [Bacillus alkalicellulosilyticus]|uniref:hypothetical protein n=1 Tax=Alkalihalobacterium alkalicellulosilyticum TaxID=1912214 RepID=UPI0014822E8F|nr:hypothetical protein [Bacillus alkalicellulosilyticus]
MKIIPFENTWPYEKVMGDIYIHTCPYCGSDNVLTSMKKRDLENALDGVKTLLIMPCCKGRMTIIEADEDYFWTNQALRK